MLRKIIKALSSQLSALSKKIFLCLFSAILLIPAFSKFNFWYLAWVGFVPLFFAIQNQTKTKSFLFAYFTGVVFWLGTIYWLIHVTLPGMLLLVLYLALYFGIFGLIIYYITRYALHITQLFFIPSIWVILEYFRSHLLLGFPWALLGYSQYKNLPVIQIADITGVWGVSFLVMMANVAVYKVVSSKSSVISKINFSLPLILTIFSIWSYGCYKIHHLRLTTYDLQLKISVIQGNISQELKWDERYRDFIIGQYLELTAGAAKDKPDLIIWPEASLPDILEEEPLFFDQVKYFVKEIKIPLLLGAVTTRDNNYYNSAILISSAGQKLRQYDKIHLVPFGEYIPLRNIFKFLARIIPVEDFTPGREYTVFNSIGKYKPFTLTLSPEGRGKGDGESYPAEAGFSCDLEKQQEYSSALQERYGVTNFSVLICFEDLFPELARRFVKEGSGYLVNITNDAWFKKTPAPYQHLQASVFRAVENRVFLARAANTGVSGFISPSGKIISLVKDSFNRNIFISGDETGNIIVRHKGMSFYTRYGDIFILLLLIFLICDIFYLIRFNNYPRLIRKE